MEFARAHVAHLTYQIAYNNIRPDCSSIHSIVEQLITDCWNKDPHLRPSFSEIIARLKRIKKMKLQVDDDDDLPYSTRMQILASDGLPSPRLPLLMDNSGESTRSIDLSDDVVAIEDPVIN